MTMNIWRRGALRENPYRRTAFRLARVSPAITDRSVIVESVAQTRQVSEADPEAHVVDQQPVTADELNQAELILLDPKRRVLEELMEHVLPPDPAPVIENLLRQVEPTVVCNMPGGKLPWIHYGVAKEWLTEACKHLPKTFPPLDPGMGAEELEVVPPWGRSGA